MIKNLIPILEGFNTLFESWGHLKSGMQISRVQTLKDHIRGSSETRKSPSGQSTKVLASPKEVNVTMPLGLVSTCLFLGC